MWQGDTRLSLLFLLMSCAPASSVLFHLRYPSPPRLQVPGGPRTGTHGSHMDHLETSWNFKVYLIFLMSVCHFYKSNKDTDKV